MQGNSLCGNIQVSGSYDLAISNKIINVSCSNDISFKLIHNYLGNSYTIEEFSGKNFNYAIDDSGCYGLNYKSNCDYISTLYASWALKEINENFPEEYLGENQLDNRTIDHALGYLLSNNEHDKDWLLNNYLEGYWSYYSASISQVPDYFVSSIATYALKEESIFGDAKKYLEDKTKERVLDSSMILYLLFNDEVKLPSISISPGIVNKKNSFNLKIKNNRDPITISIESPNFTNLPSSVLLNNELDYTINVNDEYPLLPPPRDVIRFLNEDVNITLNFDESLTDEIIFVNNWNFKLDGITINATGRLKEILNFDKKYFESIESNETIATKIHLNENENPQYKYYDDYIIVRSPKKTIDAIRFSITFEGKTLSEDSEILTNEIECETDEDCETGEICEENSCISTNYNQTSLNKPKPQERKSLWWLWLIIIFVIGIIIFFFFMRKKEVTKNFNDYAKEIGKK